MIPECDCSSKAYRWFTSRETAPTPDPASNEGKSMFKHWNWRAYWVDTLVLAVAVFAATFVSVLVPVAIVVAYVTGAQTGFLRHPVFHKSGQVMNPCTECWNELPTEHYTHPSGFKFCNSDEAETWDERQAGLDAETRTW